MDKKTSYYHSCKVVSIPDLGSQPSSTYTCSVSEDSMTSELHCQAATSQEPYWSSEESSTDSIPLPS